MTTTEIKHTKTVVTWQDDRGNTLDICTACDRRLKAEGAWPRNPDTGVEYCQVSHGKHSGRCGVTH